MHRLTFEMGMERMVLSYSINLTSVELMLCELGVIEMCWNLTLVGSWDLLWMTACPHSVPSLAFTPVYV